MAHEKHIALIFPTGGIDRSMPYSQQRPFTTADCLNIIPTDTVEGRERGGSRPGWLKSFYEEIGPSGGPCRMASEVTYIQRGGRTYWEDAFEGGALGGAWATAGWGGLAAPLVIESGQAIATYASEVGATRTAISPFSGAAEYDVGAFLVPYQGAWHGIYSIYCRMDTTTPVATTAGVVVELEMTGTSGSYDGRVIDYSGGTPTVTDFTAGSLSAAKPGWLRVNISGTTVTVYWQDATVATITASAAVGHRVGFGLEATTVNGVCLMDRLRVVYSPGDNSSIARRLFVVSGGGELWRERQLGVLSEVGTGGTDPEVSSDHYVDAQEHLQVLYIADWSAIIATATDGVVSGGGTTFDSATYTDWTTLGIDVDEDVVVIDGASGGTYRISAVAAGSLTLAAAATVATGLTFKIQKGAMKYTPATDAVAVWTATSGKGQVPTGRPLICLYRDRIVLAGPDHVWEASRSGDPLDWDYTAADDDPTRAISATNAPLAGRIGEPITALIAYTDHFMLFGCTNSMYLMSGDPAVRGELRPISLEIGVLAARSWCRTPNGAVIFLSREGLYAVSGGSTEPPTELSVDRLPADLRDIDPNLVTPLMAYDVRRRGVWIFLTREDEAPATHWFFDIDSKGFFPVDLPNDLDPTAIHFYRSPNSLDSGVLLGCRDGYCRRQYDFAESDDGTAISSYVMLGPFLPGGHDYLEGMLTEMTGVLGEASGPVDWSLRVALTHELLLTASAFTHTGTWAAGLNYKVHPRARGHSLAVRMANGAANRAWAFERINAVFRPVGRTRKP